MQQASRYVLLNLLLPVASDTGKLVASPISCVQFHEVKVGSWYFDTYMTHDTTSESSTGPKCTTAATSSRRWVVRKMAREDKPRTRFHDCHFMLQGATKRRKITVSHLVSSIDFYLIATCKFVRDVDGVFNANSPISSIFSTDLKCCAIVQGP